MSFHWCDNIHTNVFTPRDYQVELLASAFERNTMVCLGHKSSKDFITLKLLQELSRQARATKKHSIYLTCQPTNVGSLSMSTMLQHLTDLKVFLEPAEVVDDFRIWLLDYDVYIIHPRTLYASLKGETFKLEEVNLLVLEDCHELDVYEKIAPIFQEFYRPSEAQMPKVLGLAGPLHSAGCALQELGAMLNSLEDNVHCSSETASDIVTVLRYCAKPFEYIVQCAPFQNDELTSALEDIICTRKAFLADHRYDPTEIYSADEFLEELKDIPDPKKEPIEFLDIMLTVLHEMGPWCADRVALNMFHRIEKQKIKTPHERHYLLLCLVNTALFEIRAICEQTFRRFSNHKELVERYSSPKVLRLLEILRHFKPEEFISDNETMQKLSQDLEKLDFQKVTRTLEFSCQNVENIATRQQLESRSIIENLDAIIKSDLETASSKANKVGKRIEKDPLSAAIGHAVPTLNTHSNRRGNTGQNRGKRRPYMRRQTRGLGGGENGDGLDTLCGIIFCNSNYTARVLFDLLAEMSRHDAELKFLKCQFTTDRVADPQHEPKEAELEHRRQEEVLKRFRMHDSNVLIGTSVLEEGIDLPKCNLVVRWDPPTTYRSYVQCKGRARSSPAYHVILVAPKFDVLTSFECTHEQVADRTHQFLCRLDESQANSIDSDSNEGENSDEDNPTLYTSGSVKGTVRILNPEVITHQPPTKSEKILKEICDGEISAIEVVKNGDCMESIEDRLTLIEILDESVHSTESFTTANETSIGDNGEFELMDLNTALAKLEASKKNSSLNSSKNSNNSFDEKTEPELELNDSNAKSETEDQINSQSSIDDVIETKDVSQKTNGFVHSFKCCLHNKATIMPKNDLLSKKEQQMNDATNEIVEKLAQYREIEKMLLQKCANFEPPDSEHHLADKYTHCVEPYKPQSHLLTGASVDLSTSIALVNKYCSKLPSDTFTKLTALYRCAKTIRNDNEMFQYTVRLPINSPLKYDVVGLPMFTNVLARRMAALQACIELHKCGELDDNLQPIGKEGFRAIEPDWENFDLEEEDEKIVHENCEPRPGTTKRRQYYYKRIASEFCDCRPTVGVPCYLYLLDLTLKCPIPEEQNTRGRKIYPPEDAQQGFGILTLKRIPKVSSFPIFTRSGEVKVSIELAKQQITLTANQIRCINTFVNYTFTNVLRLQKFLMIFDPDSTENCVFIVPTIKTNSGKVIDWQFLELIENNAGTMPSIVPEEERKTLDFDANRFKDAVVMPWYRNQDQPQYFYVAEICPQLSPLSCFPGENYNTFKHYYFVKYGLAIQNAKQPLLDVDHTSARLNFLTPRYVNRKGVALPTSSEETKRAKRENLEQKQILVPELCTVHPFPASLWRTAVCLPCILYRINGLLLADDIRKKVSTDIALGKQEINEEYEWPMLDFGWSFSEVLKKSKESQRLQQEKSNLFQGIDENSQIVDNEAQKNNQNADKKVEDKKNDEDSTKNKKSANEICREGEKKLQENLIEIGTWSNDMADDIDLSKKSDLSDDEDAEFMKYLPSNVSFCDQQMRYGSPTFWDIKESNFETSAPNGLSSQNSRMGASTTGGGFSMHRSRSSNNRKQSFSYYGSDGSLASSYDSVDEDEDADDSMVGPYHIAFTSKNEAESYETAAEIEQRQKQLSIIQATTANERNYQQTKNLQVGYNFTNLKHTIQEQLRLSIAQFVVSTKLLNDEIRRSGMLVTYDRALTLPRKDSNAATSLIESNPFCAVLEAFAKLLPYVSDADLVTLLQARNNAFTLADLERLNLEYIRVHANETFTIIGTGDIFDNFNDKNQLTIERQNDGSRLRQYTKRINLNFENTLNRANAKSSTDTTTQQLNQMHKNVKTDKFSFDYQPDLAGHPGPSPSIILQALTMSNANDGINLERLETIGDSFLKYAITTYLYITYENVHEGKLSHLRSKQVANLNLYRLGRRKKLGEYMIATKFEPHDNWLPPCYYVPKELEKALIEAKIPPHHWKLVDLPNIKKLSSAEICELVKEKADKLGLYNEDFNYCDENKSNLNDSSNLDDSGENNDFTCFIPYNLVTQHSIPDKSIADCVEALIGAYLIECGPRGALIFMAWLGIRVLPFKRELYESERPRAPGSTLPDKHNMITIYGDWKPPKSPLLHHAPNAEQELQVMLEGFDEFESILGYKFRDRSYLLQAMTHASYSPNRLTDCYQRLEFLGDAVLDYLITRHLYEDPWQHSPGALTDLRSALVNNTIFASLAVRHGFHKYFRHLSPGLNEVIDRFVRIQNENGHCISEEYYLLSEEECDDAEDVEVPKALGDVFESVAGAIFLDSGMSLDTVWKVYSNMMKPEIEQFSSSVPKSPIRELLELEPETAKFGKPEKLADGRRVRVTVDVFCKGTFRGIGRNYRIAKNTAAKCALRELKKHGFSKKD